MLRRIAAALLALVVMTTLACAATLLPPGEIVFLDDNGKPLTGGTVSFYIPGTLTPKSTYKNSAATVSNTNPVTLDFAGRAIIYGTGSYRQIVKDFNGNLIWDQITSDASVNNVSFAGIAGGTGNAIILTDPSFTATDGQQISFIASATNTGPVTVSIAALPAPAPVDKNSQTGVVPLVGREIVAGNLYTMVYSTSLSLFVLMNPVTLQTDPIEVSPNFCPYNQLNGTIPNDACVQSAINYACTQADSHNGQVFAGTLVFGRGQYYLKTGVLIPKSCAGLQLVGQGSGNAPDTHSGTYIISDNNCTGPVINFYGDATQNYVQGGGVRNMGFFNNILSSGNQFGSTSCKKPLIQANHGLHMTFSDLYAWQPYQFIKLDGGLYPLVQNMYLDQALQDSPGMFEFTGSGAGASDGSTGAADQLTRQDEVVTYHVYMFANVAPQTGHKLPVGIWWHGFSASLKLFDTEMEYASNALKIDCTSTGVAPVTIGACPQFGVFNDFETEGANGGGTALVDVTDAQSLDFNFLYAACFEANSSPQGLLGGCNNVVHVRNSLFNQTGTFTIRGGQINGARADGIDYEGFNLTVTGGTHLWGNNRDHISGGSDIVLETPIGADAFGSHIISGNLFCVAPSGATSTPAPVEDGVHSIAGNDYVVVTNNVFRGCSAGQTGSVGAHGIVANNAGP